MHELLPKDLDFFVMLSSLAGIIGAISQANYAAGNTYQDQLAYYRRSKGLPAVSLNLGAIEGTGYVAENKSVAVGASRMVSSLAERIYCSTNKKIAPDAKGAVLPHARLCHGGNV